VQFDEVTNSSNPDLQEFLTALTGFLSKPVTPADPTYLRSLEIFFRTVKANRGHILKVTDGGGLFSVTSYGMGETFDQDFNEAHRRSDGTSSPLDQAFIKEEPIAVVNLGKEPNIPEWFMELMSKYHIRSLVAVPLIGKTKPVGILCAYYEDICLFDEGTLHHLMLLGRMVGGASEKSWEADSAEFFDERERVLDQFLVKLMAKPVTKNEVYSQLAEYAQMGLQASGILTGPIVASAGGLKMSVVAGKGTKASWVSKDLPLSSTVAGRIKKIEFELNQALLKPSDLGGLKEIAGAHNVALLARPLWWRGKMEGGIIAWRAGGPSFKENEYILLNRLANTALLALKVG